VSETRRHALKMLGTIGLTCAFPFPGDELYGQHAHASLAQATATGPYTPTFFTPTEYRTLARLADVIIPASATPSASSAGVPEYVDRVVSMNAEHQRLIRTGLAWLEAQARTRYGKGYLDLSDAEHTAILQPLSDEVDRQQRAALERPFRKDAKRGLVYYVAINDKSSPASAAASARPTDDARRSIYAGAAVPADQEPDGRRLLHIAHRAHRRAWIHRQYGPRELPLLHHQGALSDRPRSVLGIESNSLQRSFQMRSA
jgi:Gluconate 2-dehydrogenase subunit 3